MTPAPSRPLPRHVSTFVVGAGFAGLALAIRLDRAGERNYLVAERGADVGGTWRDNTYPGAACDVPSQLYSYSFALSPTWSRSFSHQPEIQAYIQRVAHESGVLDRFRFGVEVEETRWDEPSRRWHVRTSQGDLTADVVVAASGALSEPRLPDIDGIDTFAGEVFHSAQWHHTADLRGKRVAVIGTGASAIQIVPELAKVAAHLDVYQRTAPWVIPRHDRAYTRAERFAFRHVPGVQRLYRTAIYWGRECYVPAFTRRPELALPARLLAKANIARGIPDPELRRKVTPSYAIGCKRILISNTYYPALAQDHVDLVTDRITKITPTGVVTADGTERPIDVLVVATGFHTTDMPIAHQVIGREGRTLAQEWEKDGVSAYKGATVHGFPNLFFLVGPNTGLGHSSMIYMIESQVAYVVDALATMRERDLVAVEPKRGEQEAWNADLQQRMKRTVWNSGGCSSWYLDEHGRNVTLWPRATFTFRRLTRTFDAGAYHLFPAAEAPTDPPNAGPVPADLQELPA